MNAPRTILLHGFTQTAACCEPFIVDLEARGVRTMAPELPGHGTGSGTHHEVTGDLAAGARALIERLALSSPCRWIGYSMGARLALHVALAAPELVSALVLISGTAGIDDPSARARRRSDDDRLADHIEDVGVESFLEEWLAKELFATLPPDPERVVRRAANSARGLASSLRHWGTGTMDPPLWPRLHTLSMPTLVVVGANDTKFREIGTRLVHEIGPNAQFVSIRGAGHAVHLERPRETAARIATFFNDAPVPTEITKDE